MRYIKETRLEDFNAWGGGKNTLDVLKELDLCGELEKALDRTLDQEGIPTEAEINNFLWHKSDYIALLLGYFDWDSLVNGDDIEQDCTDINGEEIYEGVKVHWHDVAGFNEDGSMIDFTVVDKTADGYYNLANEGEEYPERWAYCGEIEII